MMKISCKILYSFGFLLLLISGTIDAQQSVKTVAEESPQPELVVPENVSGSGLVTFNKNGYIAITSPGNWGNSTIKLLDIRSREPLRTLTGNKDWVKEIMFGPDARLLASGSADKTIKIWDVSSGTLLHTLEGHEDHVDSIRFSQNGRIAASRDNKKILKLWDVRSGRELRTFPNSSAVFSPKGHIVAINHNKSTTLWDMHAEKALHTFPGHAQKFTPDGRKLAVNDDDRTTTSLWNIRTGEKLHTFSGYTRSFSPDGQIFVTVNNEGLSSLWDVQTGKALLTFAGYAWFFSPDGQNLIGSKDKNTLAVWDVQTGEMLYTFLEPVGQIFSAKFSLDGKFFVTGSRDLQFKLWDIKNGKKAGTLMFTGGDDWLFLTPEMQFDATPGAMQHMYWVVGLKPLELCQFKPDAFQPGLFSRLLDLSGSVPQTRPSFAQKPPPLTEFLPSDLPRSLIRLRITDQGGGIGRVVVSLNGREVIVDARGEEDDHQAHAFELAFDLSENPFLKSGEENIIEVKAFNAEEFWVSPVIRQVYQAEMTPKKSPKPQLVVQTGHSKEVTSLAFSSGNHIFASAGRDNTIKLWDIQSGKQFCTFSGSSVVTFSPDGSLLAGRSDEKTITLWDVRTGKALRTLTGRSVETLIFSSDDKFIISGNRDSMTLWDNNNAKELRTLKGTFCGIMSGTPDSEDSPVVCVKHGDSLSFRNIISGETLLTLNNLPNDQETVVVNSSNGHIIASGVGSMIKLWDRTAGKELHTLAGHTDEITVVTFSSDGNFLASGSRDATIRLWNVHTGQMLRTFAGHSSRISALTFSPKGKFMVSASSNVLKLWDVRTGREIRTFPSQDQVDTVAISSDGHTAASGGIIREQSTIKLWDVCTVKELRTLPTKYRYGVRSLNFSPDGRTIVGRIGNIDIWFVKSWDVFSGRERCSPRSPESYSLAFSPDGRLIASGDFGYVYFMDAHTCQFLNRFFAIDPELISGKFIIDEVAFSPNGHILASVSSYHTIKLWDVQENKELHTLIGHADDVYDFAFSPDGRMLVSGSGDKRIILWDVKTGKALREFQGHTDGVISVAFNADGDIIASASHDKTIILWDVHSGQILHTFRGPSGSVNFSPDLHRIASKGSDETLTLWDVSTGKEIVTFIVVNTSEHVITTPDHYYTASKGGYKGVAFRVGDKIYPFEQFDLKFNRPDIILQRIGCASQELIDANRRAYEKRLKKMNFKEEMLGDDFHLPETKLLDDALPISTIEKQLTFNVKAIDSKYLLDRLNVYVNNVPVYGTSGINLRDNNTSEHKQGITLELSNGQNKIQVSALNQQGAESLSETFDIEYTGPSVQSDLYVLAVGVSEYTDRLFNLDYAAKDAVDIVTFFQENSQNFGRIHIKRLLNTEAAKEKILVLKDWLMQSRVDDQVILFFAGHGLLTDQFDYYFATSDIDFAHPAERGVAYEAIEALLDGVPARRKLLLMDTCHSGEVDKDDVLMFAATTEVDGGTVRGRASRTIAVDGKPVSDSGTEKIQRQRLGLQNSFELMRSLFADLRKGSGAVVISSASGLEFAFESEEWNNGVFTYSLLRGLQGEADSDQDQRIRVSELQDYVTEKVKALTNNKQTPTVRRENLEFDFQIY